MFTRNESFSAFLYKFPLTSFFIITQILVWAFFALPLKDAPYWFSALDGYNAAIAHGEWWRLATPVFLHANFSHLFFNTISIILFAPALEEMLGKAKFILLYIGSAILANAATFMIQPLEYSHVGASGAIFGLFGCYLFMALFRKNQITRANAQVLLIILALSFLTSFFSPSTNVTAHFFGLVSGFGFSSVLIKKEAFAPYSFYSGGTRRQSLNWNKKNLLWTAVLLLALLGIISRFF
ncbi:rhomboid family intramembrane serine protease [Bacillus sp. FJAT-42376]|uniref:rhomboid family intramembrane serine protease n=1 Tax=Bacillus sp. FJAT-42376 TaxID=2014076 RepID=UPI000F4E2984|nr:rhomboid family intramembrane serine protease [Bacillus sp. FJAT-42376]AZB41376.1 rhomboid family intramembrane serine protease [Bacillus sp. FJAT-42376]